MDETHGRRTNLDQDSPIVKHHVMDNVKISYLDYQGPGPALVMLHATGFLPWLWHPIARVLSSRYRVIAPYFCDHRGARPHEGGTGWLDLAEDLKRLCGELNLARPFFLGHSMGATVLVLAHALRGLPAAKMMLIEPILLPRDFYRQPVSVEQHPLAAKALKRRNSWRNPKEALLDFKAKRFFQSWDDEVLALYLQHGIRNSEKGDLELTCPPQCEAALFMGSCQCDPWPVLPQIKCPTLIVEGANSENRSFIDLKQAAEQVPAGQYLLVENAGHLVPMEQPIQTIKILEAFLGGETLVGLNHSPVKEQVTSNKIVGEAGKAEDK